MAAAIDRPGAEPAPRLGLLARIERASPLLAIGLAGACFPLLRDSYWAVIVERACVYWILVSGLNLVVGFAGQIAIGWVGLLTLGAYTTSVLAASTTSVSTTAPRPPAR